MRPNQDELLRLANEIRSVCPELQEFTADAIVGVLPAALASLRITVRHRLMSPEPPVMVVHDDLTEEALRGGN